MKRRKVVFADMHTVMHPEQSAGFTLVEILVAMAIFAIMATTLVVTMTGVLDLNANSQTSLARATTTQDIAETVKSAWNMPNPGVRPLGGTAEEQDAWNEAKQIFDQSYANYTNACLPAALLPNNKLPENTTVTVQGFDNLMNKATASAAVALSVQAQCPQTAAVASGTTVIPSVQRITVTTDDVASSTIVLDIISPK